jgi:hypothetical protein
VVIVILSLLAYAVLTMPDRRTGAEKLGDAISELPNGADKAARQLEDRTPGQKLGDAVEDAGENAGNTIRRNTQESPND